MEFGALLYLRQISNTEARKEDGFDSDISENYILFLLGRMLVCIFLAALEYCALHTFYVGVYVGLILIIDLIIYFIFSDMLDKNVNGAKSEEVAMEQVNKYVTYVGINNMLYAFGFVLIFVWIIENFVRLI